MAKTAPCSIRIPYQTVLSKKAKELYDATECKLVKLQLDEMFSWWNQLTRQRCQLEQWLSITLMKVDYDKLLSLNDMYASKVYNEVKGRQM